jgi:hypothetical protein
MGGADFLSKAFVFREVNNMGSRKAAQRLCQNNISAPMHYAIGLKGALVCGHGAAHIIVTHLGILDSQMVVYGSFAYLSIEDFKIGPIKPNALFS